MKVVAINGSPKSEGNTAYAITVVLKELESKGIETDVIHIGNSTVKGCTGCGMCSKNKDERCIIDDDVNIWIQQMKKADGLLFASPVYYSGINGTMKAFMDRVFYIGGANGGFFRHKVGASIVAVRRSGGLPAFQQLNTYLNYAEMMIPSSNYWNVIYGRVPGDARKDEEGNQIMRVLGRNMAWLMQMIDSTKDEIPKPIPEKKIYTHFL